MARRKENREQSTRRQARADRRNARTTGGSSRPNEETRPLSLLRAHDEAALVPELPTGEYAALLADISRQGLLVPLDINAVSVVLDGRQRLRAAQELGLAEVPVRLVAPVDERDYILGAALQRRHLTQSQRAALVLERADYAQLKAEARKRSRANLRRSTEVATLPPRGERTRDALAREAGVSPRTLQDAATVMEDDAQLFEEVKAGRIVADRAARRIQQRRRAAELGSAGPLPQGPFEILLVDPPWSSPNPEARWSPENHYPTMALDEIKAIAIPAADDSLLYLWTPAGLLPQALDVISGWGFDYKTELVWVKEAIGLGNYLRLQHESLLIGRRGSFACPEPANRPSSVIEAPKGRHSEKPEGVYELIEQMYPLASKVELFARRKRPGWVAWGNEAPS